MKLVALSIMLLCVAVSGQAKKRSENTPYINQELIDTSILRAFVLLNESADMAGVGFGHQRSLIEAKKIARNLKSRAKGDPNERYVLWKVGELEAQIYLEERELVMQQMRKRQMSINELVDKFNIELGKWRPDFATLYRIHKNMDQIDAGKAGEFADSYNRRKNALSREVPYFLEKALCAGQSKKAQKELGYLLRNQMYLNVSTSKYKQLEDRVEGLIMAEVIGPEIDAAARSAEGLLDRMNIIEARKTLDSARNKLVIIKQHLPEGDGEALFASLKRARRKLGKKEDSLVDVNIAILRNKGIEAADRYLQSVLRPYGVSRSKTAEVDRMIISVKSPNENTTPSAIAGLEVDDEDDNAPNELDNVLFAAQEKARMKMDSIAALREAQRWREMQEQARRDSIEAVARAAEEAAYRKKRARVDAITMRIYNLLERGKARRAQKLLKKKMRFLQTAMVSDDLDMLRTTVERFADYSNNPKKTINYVESVATSSTSSYPTSEQRLPSPPPSNTQANLDRAQVEILGIYTLLEQNQIDRAYRRFLTNKKPLKKYLQPEVFSMLEMTVVQAYQYYSSQQ